MPDRKLKVFLCHATQDKPIVRELYEKLLAEAWIDPWLDEEKLLPGQDWEYEIEKALDESDAVCVCISNTSVSKEGFVQWELRFVIDTALRKPDGAIYILPVRLEGCDLPRKLRHLHYADYFPHERRAWAYERLRKSLELRAEKLGLSLTQAAPKSAKPHPVPNPKTETTVSPEPLAAGLTRHPATVNPRPENWVAPPPPISTPSLSDRATWGGIEFCRIPAGPFRMGSANSDQHAYDNEKPQHTVEMPYDYWLARYPVTNEQYGEYVEVRGNKHPVSDWHQKKDHPVVDVWWMDAIAYCRWLNGRFTDLRQSDPSSFTLLSSDLTIRLPSEAEWEKAARGTDGRAYPWGDTFDSNKCNTYESGKGDTTPVGLYSPQGDSLYGCADMSGNAWEWTRSLAGSYPYDAHDGREEQADPRRGRGRALRGGSYGSHAIAVRCAHNSGWRGSSSNFAGLRVAACPVLS